MGDIKNKINVDYTDQNMIYENYDKVLVLHTENRALVCCGHVNVL